MKKDDIAENVLKRGKEGVKQNISEALDEFCDDFADEMWEAVEQIILLRKENAALRERLDKAVELPYQRKRLLWGDKDKETLLCPDCLTDLMGGIGEETFVVQCPNCGCFVDCMVEPIPFTEAAEARLKELQGGEE